MHCVVKNANLCLEQNSFISYLLKTRMNKNILLQGKEDYQGFSDYWILHLPKHILKLGAEAWRDKGTQILPPESRWWGGRGLSQQHLQPPLGTSCHRGQEQLWREGRENFYSLRIMIQRVLRQRVLQNPWATFLHQKKFLHICSGPGWWPSPPACRRWESHHINGNSTSPFTTSLVSILRTQVPLWAMRAAPAKRRQKPFCSLMNIQSQATCSVRVAQTAPKSFWV